jgi:hypothetical protein
MLLLAFFAIASHAQSVATLTVSPGEETFKVPADYIGLSYESMQLSDPDFFSPANKGLIELCRRLSPDGVLRLGGNSSELSWWKPTEDASIPPEVSAAAARTGGGTNRTPYTITPKGIDNLAGFLKATGWTLIYNLNFGSGTPERDSAEAAYVAAKVGRRLKSFQIGNEPDLYTNRGNGGRPPGWSFDDYVNEWSAIADAVSKRVPDAKFGGPDVAGNSDWVVRFGEAMKPRLGDRLAMLSGHYYAMGPAGGKNITIERLLSPQPRVAQTMDKIESAAQRLGLAYRLTEGNSCYRGGQAGVSNAFASALWGGDYLLEMASHGNSGVNLHGGGGRQIGASLGNQIPGARNDADLATAMLGSFYTPIAGNLQAGFTARSIFYGMMLAEKFAGKTLVKTTLDAGTANVTAYAARDGNGYIVALFNKDTDQNLIVNLGGIDAHRVQVWRLTGPSLDSTEGTTLAGASLGPHAAWRPARTEWVNPSQIPLPRASAALIFVGN